MVKLYSKDDILLMIDEELKNKIKETLLKEVQKDNNNADLINHLFNIEKYLQGFKVLFEVVLKEKE